MQHAVLQLDERFRRGARDLHIRTGKIEHIGRGIDRPQHAVGIEQRAGERCAETIGKHDLEDIALVDIVLCLFDHFAVGLFAEERCQFAGHAAFGLCGFLAVLHELCHLCKPAQRLVIFGFRFIEPHIRNEDQLLPEVIERDDLIEQHQIEILEMCVVFLCGADARLLNIPPDRR